VTRIAGIAVFTIAALLLTSIGGAGIVAAPVTLPVLFVVVHAHPTRPFRVAGAVIGALTAAEASWAIVYAAVGEAQPWVWLVPLVAGAAVGWCVATPSYRGSIDAP
jgi:hypothetical protein